MKLALTILLTDRSIEPDRLALAAEERGFEGLFVPEHSHIPVRNSPHPGGEELGDGYKRLLDPLVVLTAAAMATTELRLGTAITLLAQHNPMTFAKQIATLDQLSNGRVVLGIGYGWNRPEIENHGIDFLQRHSILREKVQAIRRLWSEDEPSFDGDWVKFGPSWCWPKPLQPGGPPILLGAQASDRAFRDVLEYCDGWMPVGAHQALQDLGRLRGMAAAQGRNPDDVLVNVVGTAPRPDRIEALSRVGVDRVILRLPSGPESDVIAVLDEYARLVEVAQAL